jgi:hypothetical protein
MWKKQDVKSDAYASGLDSSTRFKAGGHLPTVELGGGRVEDDVFELPDNEEEIGSAGDRDGKKNVSMSGGDKEVIQRREVGGPPIPISKFSAS